MENPINSDAAITHMMRKVADLFALDKITAKDIENLDKPERDYLAATFTKVLERVTGVERDNFLAQIDEVIPPVTKAGIWEQNHQVISNAVAGFMCKHGVMPTKNDIALQTGISRQTVAKHLGDYKQQPLFIDQMERFKFMGPQMLANVFKLGLNGDTKAARLYLEMIGSVNRRQGNTIVNEQNNYIQINNTILSQETLKNLTAEQLNQIESIITGNGPAKI